MKKLTVVLLVLAMVTSMVFAQGGTEAASSGKTTIRVLNYIDMSEPNSANEVEMVWNEFSRLHPEIEVIREDLFNEPFHMRWNHMQHREISQTFSTAGQAEDLLLSTTKD